MILLNKNKCNLITNKRNKDGNIADRDSHFRPPISFSFLNLVPPLSLLEVRWGMPPTRFIAPIYLFITFTLFMSLVDEN